MNDKTNHDLTSFLTKLTSEPGVYRMLDEEAKVLYVGKASNLKKRVTSYFNKQNNGAKTRSLVSQIKSIEVSITRSETEALLLESNLIKALRPKYNILMRDDKSYPYIFVSTAHPYPRMELYRSKKKPQKGEFYGPFPSAGAARETLNLIQKIFKIRNCTDSFFSARSRPCLQYQIKRCNAPCTQYIGIDAYSQSLNDARLFLQGKSQLIIDELVLRMNDAVSKLAFEEAASLRDQIKNLRVTQEQQAVAHLSGDADVIAIEAKPGFACIQCVRVREGNIIASQSYFPSMPSTNFNEENEQLALWEQVFEAFVAFHYVPTPGQIPNLIITHQAISEQSTIEAMLSELATKKCKIQTKPRGAKSKWLDFALNNLQLSIAEKASSQALVEARFKELERILALTKPIRRMECFDISHTLGEATIASCVVFDENGPCTSLYRRFNINGITPGDDYAAMQQAIGRRFKRLKEEQNLPDLLLIDGGKGQVAIAKKMLDELDIHEVYLLGIAKGPGRKAGLERLILVNEAIELSLAPDSKALHLLQHIRDEAHRFAITAHRKKLKQARLDSSLEELEGIGPKRRKALLQRFGGIRDLAKAPIEEIAKVTGVSKEMAERIYNHFHP